MTKIDELIELSRNSVLSNMPPFDRLAAMLRLAVKQRNDWIKYYNYEHSEKAIDEENTLLEAELEAYEIGSSIEARRGDELAAKLKIAVEALEFIDSLNVDAGFDMSIAASNALERLK